ncbi:hypothetical protein DdX_18349 [Ditylenchus destructor]|uniref:Uncharacterized protein n=1 Tax=Ditylenchus destructor TaxID=166010 RepID=A0AAD4MPP1_9BILA|nr:hypothetical protein DdX_18349 [Ditylenchus destructor]
MLENFVCRIFRATSDNFVGGFCITFEGCGVLSNILPPHLWFYLFSRRRSSSHRLSASLPPLSSAHASWPPLSSAHAALPPLRLCTFRSQNARLNAPYCFPP